MDFYEIINYVVEMLGKHTNKEMQESRTVVIAQRNLWGSTVINIECNRLSRSPTKESVPLMRSKFSRATVSWESNMRIIITELPLSCSIHRIIIRAIKFEVLTEPIVVALNLATPNSVKEVKISRKFAVFIINTLVVNIQYPCGSSRTLDTFYEEFWLWILPRFHITLPQKQWGKPRDPFQ